MLRGGRLNRGLGREGLGRESRQEAENRLTASLAGLATALALVILSLFLADHLRAHARLEDCLLAGRTNCAVQLQLGPAR